MDDCVFCKIVRKEIPARIQYENEDVIAFDDLHPAADTHILVIPKKHIEKASDLSSLDASLLMQLFEAAKMIAQEKNIPGYKLHINVGKEAGQMVMHLHMHVLAGRFQGDIKAL